RLPPSSTLFPYTTLFRSEFHRHDAHDALAANAARRRRIGTGTLGQGKRLALEHGIAPALLEGSVDQSALAVEDKPQEDRVFLPRDRKSTRLNSSHVKISY